MDLLVAVIIVSVVGGLLLRRWEAIAVPAVLVPLYYVGLKSDWWGNGVGDGWQFAAGAVTLAAMLATAIAVAVSRLSFGRVGSSRSGARPPQGLPR
jgi:hypothetical protein